MLTVKTFNVCSSTRQHATPDREIRQYDSLMKTADYLPASICDTMTHFLHYLNSQSRPLRNEINSTPFGQGLVLTLRIESAEMFGQ
jgi:hypothetical protein